MSKRDAVAYDREVLRRRGLEVIPFPDDSYGFFCPRCNWTRHYPTEQAAQNAAKAHIARKHGEGKK